jgi:hypothetical protein
METRNKSSVADDDASRKEDDRGMVVCLDDFERQAIKVLTKNAFDYFRSGADDEVTLKDNENAFKRSVPSLHYTSHFKYTGNV